MRRIEIIALQNRVYCLVVNLPKFILLMLVAWCFVSFHPFLRDRVMRRLSCGSIVEFLFVDAIH